MLGRSSRFPRYHLSQATREIISHYPILVARCEYSRDTPCEKLGHPRQT